MDRRDFLAHGVAPAVLLATSGTGALAPRPAISSSTASRDARTPVPNATRARQSDDRFEMICRLVLQKMEGLRIPGVALGIRKDELTLMRGLGVANVDEAESLTPEHIFPIASISKTVTATAVMRLVEQGKLDVQAPVRRYLPDFRVADDAASRDVTLWHLLTHTPGWEGQLNTTERGDATLAEFTGSLKDLPQLARPGEVWSYNNAGFGVLGRVIEVAAGASIHAALRTLVFEPLGLTRAVSRAGDALTYRFAAGHRTRGDVVEVVRDASFFPNVTAGGTAMSLEALMRYASFHMGDAAAGAGSVLSVASVERMRTPQLTKHGTDDEMGLGWQLRRLNGVQTVSHGGTLTHMLHVQLVPERRLAFAILTNHSSGASLIQDVEREILRLYEGLTLAPNQRIAHRGVAEDMTAHATPLAAQPSPAEYVGRYLHPPLGPIELREEGGALMAGTARLAFYGPDLAFTATGALGRPYEFIRTADARVRWVRVQGRIARKDA
jgi:CubicO group peptidase (beta-lactamase class C family)